MHPYEGYDTETSPQEPVQEAATEAEAPKRSSSIIWKASVRALEGRYQESFNCNTELSTEEGDEEGKQ